MTAAAPLLAIRDFRLHLDTFDGTLRVLDGINLEMAVGETVGLVGETGCGKSITAKSILGLVPSPPARLVSGSIRFQDWDITGADAAGMRRLRGTAIAMIFQDPMTYLNPVFTVGRQLVDAILAHQQGLPATRRLDRRAARDRAIDLLRRVHLPNPEIQLDAYPHQLSGGMRQRVLIAMALSGRPKLLVADEPTTALDVTIQAQILDLIAELVRDLGLTVLMISHDLGAVASVCRRIVVMYAGTIAEDAPAERLFEQPQHPYTRGLLAAIPHLSGPVRALAAIPGGIPNLLDPPSGCRFRARCPHAMPRCAAERPTMVDVAPGHRVACHLYGPAA